MRRLQARFVPRRGYASERALPRRQLENGTVNPAEMGGGEKGREETLNLAPDLDLLVRRASFRRSDAKTRGGILPSSF